MSEPNPEFEELYLRVRQKEGRLLDDSEVALLPEIDSTWRHADEWKLRAKSFQRIRNYISSKELRTIMDLGCGNGWLAGNLSKDSDADFVAVDINQWELQQAARVFSSSNLCFCYGDIFKDIFPKLKFDLIIVNSAIQYFPSLPELLSRLLALLTKRGEIHIVDSPIYDESQVAAARQRTENYYKELGFEQMAASYYHHCFDDLRSFQFETLFRPESIRNKAKNFFGINENPFPWIKIKAE